MNYLKKIEDILTGRMILPQMVTNKIYDIFYSSRICANDLKNIFKGFEDSGDSSFCYLKFIDDIYILEFSNENLVNECKISKVIYPEGADIEEIIPYEKIYIDTVKNRVGDIVSAFFCINIILESKDSFFYLPDSVSIELYYYINSLPISSQYYIKYI